jgi:hypothetical protein
MEGANGINTHLDLAVIKVGIIQPVSTCIRNDEMDGLLEILFQENYSC